MPCVPASYQNLTISPLPSPPSFLQAAEYGKCIVADYNAVTKDMCAKQFMKLKDCFLAVCMTFLAAVFLDMLLTSLFKAYKKKP